MEIIKELDGISYHMGGPKMYIVINVYYDKYHPVTLEDFNNGEFLEAFAELEGSAINRMLKAECSHLKRKIEDYVEMEDLYLLLPSSGKRIPQIEMEYRYDI